MSWIILVSGILNLFLGLTVWLHNPKQRLNYGFAIFSFSTVLSIFFDYLFRFFPTLIVLRSSYAFATLVPLTALMWILEMCGINWRKISLWIKTLIISISGVFFIAAYVDGLIVGQIYYLTVLGYKGELGPFFPIYALYFLLFISSFIYLIYNAQRKVTGIARLQLRFVLIGVTLYSIAALTFSLILPTYFNVFNFTLLDAPSLIFFVGFTAYAILKLHFLNIKVIATELLVFTLSMFIFIRAILSTGIEDTVANWMLFALIIVTGIFLIRSVIREVEQRERIQSLADDLSKANENQVALIHFITHQIKGFFTKSRNIFSLLMEGEAGALTDTMKKYVTEGFTSDTEGVAMVQDVLSAANIKSGIVKYSVVPFDLSELVATIVAEYKKTAEEKGLRLTFSCWGKDSQVPNCAIDMKTHASYIVNGDEEQLRQVFKNLIDNSIKYTPKGSRGGQSGQDGQSGKGSIAIRLSQSVADSAADHTVPHTITFSVRDTGVGLSDEDKAVLFTQGGHGKDSPKVNVESTGYGLFIAKGIVEAHHGRMWAESDGRDKGATFYVELPGVTAGA